MNSPREMVKTSRRPRILRRSHVEHLQKTIQHFREKFIFQIENSRQLTPPHPSIRIENGTKLRILVPLAEMSEKRVSHNGRTFENLLENTIFPRLFSAFSVVFHSLALSPILLQK